jgi:hypothetical protein
MVALQEENVQSADVPRIEGDADHYDYRSVSRTAVLSVVFAALGLLSWYSPLLLFFPVLGIVFAFISFGQLKRYPEELTGRMAGQIGVVLSVLTLIVVPIRHSYIYYTELPEGYERISFAALKSPYGAEDYPPESAIALNGKKVFLKGYIHPTSVSSSATKTFVLVPDWATCCFGTQPPRTHMIEVRLTGEKFADKSFRLHKLAGVLEVRPYLKQVDGLDGVYYQLEADHFSQ